MERFCLAPHEKKIFLPVDKEYLRLEDSDVVDSLKESMRRRQCKSRHTFTQAFTATYAHVYVHLHFPASVQLQKHSQKTQTSLVPLRVLPRSEGRFRSCPHPPLLLVSFSSALSCRPPAFLFASRVTLLFPLAHVHMRTYSAA